jgi:hypothetical protein
LPYTPITAAGFKGLRLDADPQDLGLGGAVTVSNVEFDLNGTVRTRPGFDMMDTDTVAGTVRGIHHGGNYVYVTTSANLGIFNASTFQLTATEATTNLTESGERFLDGYVLLGRSASGVVHTQDAAATAQVLFASTPPSGKFVAHARFTQRAAIANDATTETNRVWFTGPIADTLITIGADDYVDLGNAGQTITALVGWRDQLFVFSDAGRYFVFYGESTDATGGAVFNYREVRTGKTCTEYGACAGPDGVYFVHTDGVYRTGGGPPELVSAALQPFFDERQNGYFTPSGPLSSVRIIASDERLYVWQKGATGMFVMDFRSREWTYWVLAVAPHALCPVPGSSREMLFADSTGRLYKLSPDYTDDDGTVIASHYQTGFLRLADGAKARVRGFHLTGSGTVDHATAVDLGAVGSSASVTLDNPGFDMRSAFGRKMSAKISAASGAWSVSEWKALIAGARGAR